MNGIEKITGKILDEARDYAAKTEADAKTEAAGIIAEAEKAASGLIDEARLQAEKEARSMAERAGSSAGLAGRNTVLEAKNTLIDRAFDLAKQKILNLDRDSYGALLASLLAEAAADVPDGRYVMSVNAKDRETAQRVIDGAAVDVLLSDYDADIEGGFILRRGDIEINCSVEKIIGGLRRILESDVFKVLFG